MLVEFKDWILSKAEGGYWWHPAARLYTSKVTDTGIEIDFSVDENKTYLTPDGEKDENYYAYFSFDDPEGQAITAWRKANGRKVAS